MSDISPKTIEPFVGPIENDSDEPLKVEITNNPTVKVSEKRSFTTSQVFIQTTDPAAIVQANPNRHSLVILNTGTITVYLMNNRFGNPSTGFPLVAGASITMEHQDAVFGLAPNATGANNAILAIYTDNRK